MGYPFAPIFSFPNIKLNEILEIEFQFGYALGILPSFNEMEFYELIWLYERMAEQRKKENEDQQKNQSGRTSMMNMFGGGGNQRG